MSKVICRTDMVIEGKKYQLQTVDLTDCPFDVDYEQILVPYQKDGSLQEYGVFKMDTSEDMLSAIEAHNAQVYRYERGIPLLKYY